MQKSPTQRFTDRFSIPHPRGTLECRRRPLIMGVLNVTPDSFADGEVYLNPDAAIERAFGMVDEGADLVDVGAESTRPGANPVSAEEEIRRLDPVLRVILPRLRVPVSVDTMKAEVADRCLALYFRAGEPYRVSHPAGCGDDCLSIELAPQTLRDIFGAETFPGTHALLEAPRLRNSRLLVRRLPYATPVEMEERALALLAGASDARSVERANARQHDMVEATRITLAAQPEEAWSLSALARRVHASPFYLARSFRRLAGMPLHGYQLQARLASALDDVLDTALDFTTIGLRLGFSSHSHFTAAFRRAFGATPSALRKEGKILTAR
jgi:AraC-like DNA-binding protein